MTPFRPKKKVGQAYFNIPGFGRTWAEADSATPQCLNDVLIVAKSAFFREYGKDSMRGVAGAADVPLSPAAWPWVGWEKS